MRLRDGGNHEKTMVLSAALWMLTGCAPASDAKNAETDKTEANQTVEPAADITAEITSPEPKDLLSTSAVLKTDTPLIDSYDPAATPDPSLQPLINLAKDDLAERLEIGCGTGISTALLAKNGAHVYSFDISPTSVTVAYKRAQINGLDSLVNLTVAIGEKLPYASNTFDIVYGRAILHHLNVGMSSPELLRVLKPGGKALFVEPLGMNPLLNYIRDHVPYPEKNPVGDDRPLHYDEINAWGKSYSQFWYKEVHFLGMIERAFGNTRKVRINILHKIDNLILKLFPFMGRFYRYVVIYMIK
jgi:ubiquinone/menaquinone biosynthesis C-methylase UbiE